MSKRKEVLWGLFSGERGVLGETYTFVHDGLEVLGLALDDGDVACCLHAYQGFEFAVDELLGWVFVFRVRGHCLHVVLQSRYSLICLQGWSRAGGWGCGM
jgi:hypothetical protein